MQYIQGQLLPHFSLFYASVGDPVFLLVMGTGFLFGLSARWITGAMTAALLAAIRVGIVDWQHFVPGTEPSATLADIFLFTVVTTFVAFAAGKLCRVVIFIPRRRQRP